MELSLPRPFDAHVHLRDGVMMQTVVAHLAEHFQRALVMPNLRPPIVDTVGALAYRERILAALPAGTDFEPLLSLYLTDHTSADEIARAAASGVVVAAKLYPAGATTNSDAGVTSMDRVVDALFALEEHEMLLLVHGEVTQPDVDVFDREARYLDEVLLPVVERHPRLRIVLEHVTTREGVQFVREGREGLAGTLTAHHLRHNRNALLAGGVHPHFYCLPILKRESHRRALVEAAVESDRFFLGTDSAPHTRAAKECAHGCAGCYTTVEALALYAEVFEEEGALDRLGDFAARRGERFYGLTPTHRTLRMVREPWTLPDSFAVGHEELVPLHAGQTLAWRVVP